MNSKLKFKETEIGLIPEDWKVGTLKNLAEFKNGKSSPERNEIGKYFVFGSNGNIGKSDEFNSEEKTIIIGRVGSYCGSVYFSKEKCWVTDNAIIGKANENSVSEYLFYLLKRLELNRHRGGSGQPLLNQTVLYNIKVALLKKEEQSAIAKILSDLDSKIELLQKQNETLEKIGQAIFKHWFVDFEFPNEDGTPYKSSGGKMVDSELGEIPKGWSVGNLGDLIYVQNGYAFKSSDFLSEGKHGIIKIKNISGNIIDIKNTQYTSDKVISKVDKKFKIESGDLLIAMTGAEVAKVGIVEKNDQSLWLNQRVGLFKETVLGGKMYSYVFLLDESKQSILKSNAHGAAQPNISASQIESLSIITPTKKILLNFFEIFNPAFNKIIGNLNEINSLQKTRDLLLPKLMTGKIRVPLEVEE